MTRERTNVTVLAACQALFMTGQTVLIILNGLVGHAMLGADKSLATLPMSTTILGMASATIPASFLMKRIGRRAGFMIGALIGVAGSAIASTAIIRDDFTLFVVGTFVIGCFAGFGQYYRFAAADAASPQFRAKAISLVVAGGVVAAVVGPELAKWTNDLVAETPFLGSYATLSVLMLGAIGCLLFLDIPPPSAAEIADPGRPLSEIARQPAFIVAVLSAMVAYGVMAMIMTATPIAMLGCGFIIDDAAFVIQWHAIAMFAPAFVTGHIIQRFGVLRVMLAGMILLVVCGATALSGLGIGQFWWALVLLGLGWNFAFVGASTLLTETYRPAERAKVQAANDFMVFGTNAIGSVSSGALLHSIGWNAVHLSAAPFVFLAMGVALWLAMLRREESRSLPPPAP